MYALHLFDVGKPLQNFMQFKHASVIHQDVCYECPVFSGRGLCDELIACPQESCQMLRVIACDLETL